MWHWEMLCSVSCPVGTHGDGTAPLSPSKNSSSHTLKWLKIPSIWNYCSAKDETGRERWKTFLYTGNTDQAVWGRLKLTHSRQWQNFHCLQVNWQCSCLAMFGCYSWKHILIGENAEIFCQNGQLNLQVWPTELEPLVLGWNVKSFGPTEQVLGSII